eukprot:gene16622-8051_t
MSCCWDCQSDKSDIEKYCKRKKTRSSLRSVRDQLWTSSEKERFWKVLENYIKYLIIKNRPLLQPDLFANKRKVGQGDFSQEMIWIRECLWTGQYSSAVAMFITLNHPKEVSLIDNVGHERELEEIKRIFMN